jgi:hypothetical protein
LLLAFGFDQVMEAFAVVRSSRGDAPHYSDDADALGERVEWPVGWLWEALGEFRGEYLLDLCAAEESHGVGGGPACDLVEVVFPFEDVPCELG